MYQSTIASSSGVGVLRDVTSRVRLITLLLYAHIRYRAGDLRWRFLNDWVEVAFLHLGRRRNRNFIMQITKPQTLVAIPNCKCGSKSSRSAQPAHEIPACFSSLQRFSTGRSGTASSRPVPCSSPLSLLPSLVLLSGNRQKSSFVNSVTCETLRQQHLSVLESENTEELRIILF